MRLPRAFTLIELMVVISVIGILFGLGIAGYRAFSENQVLDGAYKELRTQVNLARQLALSGEKPSGCTGDLLGYRVSISGTTVTLAADCITSGQVTRSTYNLPTGIQVSSWPTILFKVLGQGTNLSNDAIITITYTGSNQSINVTLRKSGILER